MAKKIERLKKLPKEMPSGNSNYGERNDARFYVDVSVITEVVAYGEVNLYDSWDRPDTESELRAIHVYANPQGQFALRKPVRGGDTVYVALIHYSTGDTFGTDSGQVSAAGVENTYEDAHALLDSLNEAYGAFEVEHKGWKYYCGSWSGYFEHVTLSTIREVAVGHTSHDDEVLN